MHVWQHTYNDYWTDPSPQVTILETNHFRKFDIFFVKWKKKKKYNKKSYM